VVLDRGNGALARELGCGPCANRGLPAPLRGIAEVFVAIRWGDYASLASDSALVQILTQPEIRA